VQAQRGQHRQVRVDRVGLALPAAPFAAGPLALDHQQPGGGQRPRQPDPVAAGARSTHRHPRPGHRLRDRGQQPREPGAVVADPHRRDRLARRIGDLYLMTVPVGIDPDDGIYRLCQHGHKASCLLPGPGADVGTGLGGVTGWHICDGSRQLADRLLIRSTRWARPGSAIWGQVSSKARNSGRIRSESPRIADTDPGGSPPRTARNDTHRSVDQCGVSVQSAGARIRRSGSTGCPVCAPESGAVPPVRERAVRDRSSRALLGTLVPNGIDWP
jgi:hypothetical protein